MPLLRRIYRTNDDLPASVLIPPGDDMGAIAWDDPHLLVTVDQLVEAVHFDRAGAGLQRIGRKAMTRNLSDVAAMAAWPVGAVAAACLPRGMPEPEANEVFEAMRTTGQSFDCPLIGGDVSIWDGPIVLSVTVFAAGRGIEPVRRVGAKLGDAVFVSGELGGSLETVNGTTHHLDFVPRIELARELAASPQTRPHCMIDLSDGLGRDLGHLCEAAGLAAQVELTRLPTGAAAQAAANRDGRPTWRHALADGEDYELCFTIDAARAERMPHELAGVRLTRIGTIVDRTGSTVVTGIDDGGRRLELGDLGWEHGA